MDGTEIDTPLAAPSPFVETGQIIADRYRLVRKLGEGAMGAVFLAEHVHMRKPFALKILLPQAMASPEIVARFEREAIAAANIGHPGVCAATDFGRLRDGSFFLVLEYVDGRSLRSVISDGAMPPARALDVARQVLSALAAAHDTGVVHRDIKPENVMLTKSPTGQDVVKVLDFGIAKVDANTLGEGQGTNLTRMGAIYGTPTYMAPEQAMGRCIDHRVDMYAVGVVLHEMITGSPPFDGDSIMVLAAHVNTPPPPLTSPHGDVVSEEVRQFVARLLAKVADARPTDARAAITELDAARATLVAFDELELATNATVMGALPASPSPLTPTVIVDGARNGVFSGLAPLAARAGVQVRTLTIAAFSIVGAVLLLLIIAAARPSNTDDVEEERPRRRIAPGAAVSSEPAPEPTSPAPTASATASASKGSGGGAIKGLGRRIKGLF